VACAQTLERDEHKAEWIALTEKQISQERTQNKPFQPETVSKGGRGNEGGLIRLPVQLRHFTDGER